MILKIIKENSPHIHRSSSVKRMMLDVLIALIPTVIFAYVQFGLKAFKIFAISILTMLLSELIFVFIRSQGPYNGKTTFKEKWQNFKNTFTINNILAPLISAIIYSLLLPADVSWYVILVGALFGIVVGKLLFGGLGGNIFNPAAVGRVFVMICFGTKLGYFATPLIKGSIDVFASATPLVANIFTWEAIKNLLVGTVSGTMGEVCKITILVGGLYLIIRKSADPRPMLSMILTFMVITLCAGFKVNPANPLIYMLYQTLSGGLLFGAIFMVTDPITSPTTRPGRITFGILIGAVSALIRLLGAYPEGVAFAILIVNMFVPVIDYYKWSTNKYRLPHFILWTVVIVGVSLVVFFAI